MSNAATEPDPLAYYSPETYLFAAVAASFAHTGQIHPEAFYLICDWKAPRARTRHLKRLAQIAGNFTNAVSQIADELHRADGNERRINILMTKWKFRLPTASAILAVLYPDVFTVYDIRTCTVLDDFKSLGDMNWSLDLWREYQRFAAAVRSAVPDAKSLRDCDRSLWGKDKRRVMLNELAAAG